MNQIIQTKTEKYNTYKNDSTKENGPINPVRTDHGRNRTINEKNTETTDADNVEHQIGPDNKSAQQNQVNVETAKEEDSTKRCADH